MNKLFNISACGLIILAALSFSDTNQVAAQGKKDKKQHAYHSDKGGPPDWAPAHGYRRKGGEDDDDDKGHKHKNKHKDKDRAYDLKRKEEELKRREEDLKRREEALKRREKGDRDGDVIHKRRPEDITKKRREAEENEKGGIFKRRVPQDDRIPEEREEIERKKEEIRKKMPTIFRKDKSVNSEEKTGTNTSGDWTGGSGW